MSHHGWNYGHMLLKASNCVGLTPVPMPCIYQSPTLDANIQILGCQSCTHPCSLHNRPSYHPIWCGDIWHDQWRHVGGPGILFEEGHGKDEGGY